MILAKNLMQKSNEKFDALAAEGVSNSEASKKISEKTYETVFGSYAPNIPAGILAYWTNTDLGTSAAATTEVAYEAIKAANTPTFNTVNAAFRSEADTYRTAATIEDAVVAQKQVSINYAAWYRMCIELRFKLFFDVFFLHLIHAFIADRGDGGLLCYLNDQDNAGSRQLLEDAEITKIAQTK